MITHTLILATPKFSMPLAPNVIEMVNELIHNNLVNIDYFGGQLDNPADYIDDEMSAIIESTSYITLHFDQAISDEIDYETDEETTLNLMLSILMENKIQEVIFDEKDIEIYIY